MNLATLSYGLTAAVFLAAAPLVAQVTTGPARRRSCVGTLLAMGAWAAVVAVDAAGWPVSLWAVLALDALRYAAAIGLLVSLGTLPLSTWVARGALALATRAARGYFDIHCTVVTPRACLDLLGTAAAVDLHPFRLDAFVDTVVDGYEFLVRLALAPAVSPADRAASFHAAAATAHEGSAFDRAA